MTPRLAFPGLRGGFRTAAPHIHPRPNHNPFTTRSYASSSTSSAYTPPPGPSPVRRWLVRLGIALAFPAAYLVGAIYPPQAVLILHPRYSPPPPDAQSPKGKVMIDQVESELQRLFIVAKFRAKMQEGGWYETRPYARFDPQKAHNSLTVGSLRGPGKLAIPPLVFAKDDESESVVIIHLGRALCGHDGIIHGGLIATVFDESLARNALMNLSHNIGVTANLEINFKSPCMADQFVVVRTKLEEHVGRKARVSATMETLDGERIAEAKGLFIEPKWAQFLQSSAVTEALGKPMAVPVLSSGQIATASSTSDTDSREV